MCHDPLEKFIWLKWYNRQTITTLIFRAGWKVYLPMTFLRLAGLVSSLTSFTLQAVKPLPRGLACWLVRDFRLLFEAGIQVLSRVLSRPLEDLEKAFLPFREVIQDSTA